MPWGWTFAGIIGDGRSTKIAKRMIVRWHLTFLQQGRLLPYAFVWEKPLKLFFAKTEHALWLNLCIYLREQEGYQSNGRTLTFDPFMVSQFCFLMHLYGKNVQNFKQLLLWSLWANFAQTSYEASIDRGNKRLLKWSRFLDQDGHHAHIW